VKFILSMLDIPHSLSLSIGQLTILKKRASQRQCSLLCCAAGKNEAELDWDSPRGHECAVQLHFSALRLSLYVHVGMSPVPPFQREDFFV